jgi:uncharacterized membrane protein
MLRKSLKRAYGLQYFTIRGDQHTRLEGLSDGVFALSIALLLISTSVPENFDQLLSFTYDFFPVAICILFLYWIWKEQCGFMLRYGLEDPHTLQLNMVLLFFVLFYTYPLKFLMSFLVTYFYLAITGFSVAPQHLMELRDFLGTTFPSDFQTPYLMLIYGFGFVAIFLIFNLMYRHALSHAEELELSAVEMEETRHSMRNSIMIVLVGLLSIVIAVAGLLTDWKMASFFSGLSYNLIWIGNIYLRKKHNKKLKPLLAESC